MRYDASDRESANVEDQRGGSSGFSLLVDKIAEYINPRHAAPKASNGVDHGRVGDGTPEEREPLKEWKTQGDELLKRAEEKRLKDDPFAPGAQSMDIGQSWLDREIARQNEDTMRRLRGILAPDFPDSNEKKDPSRIEIPSLPGYDSTAE